MRKVTNRTVTLYHLTHRDNIFSIQNAGIFGSGETKSVFAVKKSRLDWCVSHLENRRGWEFHDLIIVEFSVRRSAIRRLWRGIWRTIDLEISPSRISRIELLSEYLSPDGYLDETSKKRCEEW